MKDVETIKACDCSEYSIHVQTPDYSLQECECRNHYRKIYTLNQVKKLWSKTTRNIEIIFKDNEWHWFHRYTEMTAMVDMRDEKGIAWIEKLMNERDENESESQ